MGHDRARIAQRIDQSDGAGPAQLAPDKLGKAPLGADVIDDHRGNGDL